MIPKLSLKLSVLVYTKKEHTKKENQAHKLAKSILQR